MTDEAAAPEKRQVVAYPFSVSEHYCNGLCRPPIHAALTTATKEAAEITAFDLRTVAEEAFAGLNCEILGITPAPEYHPAPPWVKGWLLTYLDKVEAGRFQEKLAT